MRPRHVALITLTLTALGGGPSAGPAAAHVPGPDRLQRLARADVRALVSSERPDGLWRALVVQRRGVPSLVIERYDPGRVERRAGLPSLQRRVDGFTSGGDALTFTDQAVAIERLAWRRRALTFEVVTDTERLACRLPVRGPRAFVARCDGRIREVIRPTPPPPPAPPRPAPRTMWARDPDVIGACGRAFLGPDNEAACLDLARDFDYDPTAIIAACDAHTYGDDNTLACVRVARLAAVDPTRALAACDDATYGDEHTIACLDAALRAAGEPANLIRACDEAMYGDDDLLACVRVAAQAPSAAADTVRACDEAMYGDEAVLDCVRRAVSP